MTIINDIVKTETMNDDLINFFSFDEDLNGNNGPDHTHAKALALDITTIEYFIMLTDKEKLDPIPKMIFVSNRVLDTYYAYTCTDFGIKEIESNVFLLAFTYGEC